MLYILSNTVYLFFVIKEHMCSFCATNLTLMNANLLDPSLTGPNLMGPNLTITGN